jgi:hypothetical protein
MDPDLKALLESWPYDPDDCVRVVTLADGRNVMQVRLPLGVEQYELDGRPDGRRPHKAESVLDHLQAQLDKARAAGNESAFRLNPDECVELFNEGVLYYYRYLHLFQMKDWPRTVRDTGRNLRLFDFIRRYAMRDEDKLYLEQWRPYVLRISAIAAAMIQLDENNHPQALAIINNATQHIESLPDIDEETFKHERHRSIEALHELADQVEKTQPLTELQKLERQLNNAVTAEHYERAAKLRDRIRTMRQSEKHA